MAENLRKKFLVWDYFKKSDDKCTCKLCNATVSFKGFSTGTMTKILYSIHKKIGESQGVSSVKPARAGQSSICTFLPKLLAKEKYTSITRKAVIISVKD